MDKDLKDGQPCDHKGCLSHISHPREECGRIAGKLVMDAKQICEILRNPIITLDRFNLAPMDRNIMKEIADFIEQQEKLAELGRLAEQSVNNNGCEGEISSDAYCMFCFMRPYCDNKAELKGAEQGE